MRSLQPIQPSTQPARPRVVIVGAGFGGLAAVRALAKAPVEVVLINRTNYHGFWPLLYQVATAGLEPESIAYPVRAILRRYRNASFLLAEVTGVDFAQRLVDTNTGPVSYDYLILAAGSTTNFFGNEKIAQYTMGMKDLNEAQRLRNHVLLCCERAAAERDPARRAALLTFAVVGGGPTGVELAGAFVELIRHVIRHDYPMLDVQQARVVLIEATGQILASFPESLQRAALQRLQRMGVEVRLNAPVADADPNGLNFRDGSRLAAETVVWAAGVRGAPLADALGVTLGRGARVVVTPELTLPDDDRVFVIGDMAYLEGYRPGVAYPMVAPVAIQMGEQAARNIVAQITGQPMQPFRYVDKGQMATIGRSAAVLDAFGVRLSGWLAWVGWLFVHLMALVGFRNRALVLLNWAYSYFTYDRGVRLIFGVGADEWTAKEETVRY
ncbi:NAD(P)/FAD-dependent oxidoreductase [Chloroflexus sp.]|uniref:NAD(P)/FAD-dependent oxidoreductase n=1 Tax=Chloroflexus sp. TaxID=1904827 RepID=UPI00298F3547|nr:NAD(P)/FAD-dependent oxidoreductase [Chloroflexus sp.]MDW8404400.1 NAD(P)/FAD-dependent oxidoreductase [Chloroflexus sp.]